MALLKDTFAAEIVKLLGSVSKDPSPSVRRLAQASAWADAFDTYASLVTNVNLDGPVSPGNKLGFQNALALSAVTAAQTAQEFGDAWSAYWAGLAFTPGAPAAINASGECPNVGGNLIFGVIATSAITVVSDATLVLALTQHFATYSSTDTIEAADKLATIFHDETVKTASLTVLTSGTDTSGPPVPVTNTCRVF